MKHFLTTLLFCLLIASALFPQATPSNTITGKESNMLNIVHWLGHASFRIDASKTIYIDPYKLKKEGKADIILITHTHNDHLSIDDIKKIQTKETLFIVPNDGASQVSGNVKTMKPGDVWEIGAVKIEAVPAYNAGKMFHPKSNNWVGYILTIDGKRYYFAGDTDRIPEMKTIKANAAFVPIGGTYTMNAEEAAKAVIEDIKPEIAVPMHWGSIVGKQSDADKFAALLKGKVEVKILAAE